MFMPWSPAMEIASIVCLVLGVIMMGIEIFTPGFSIPGILGTLLMITGIVLGANSLVEALLMILVLLVILSIMIVVMVCLANKGKLDHSPLILSQRSSREEGYLSTQDLDYFIGRKGQAVTVLRPAGTVELNGVRLDVVTRGEFIDAGTAIVVESVEGRKIVVKAVQE